MKNLLRRFLGRPASPAALSSLADAPMTVLAVEPPPRHTESIINIDTLFYPWLLGTGEAAVRDLNEAESRRLRALKRVADSASPATADLVPRLPSVVPMLLRSLRERNVSNSQLAEQIAQDAVLVAAVLKQVNSSYFRRATPVKGIEEALAVIGLNGLRMLVASVAFKPLFNVGLGYFTNLAAPRIWELSDSCGIACRHFARRRQLDAFEAFLAGLLQYVGLIVALRVLDQLEAPRQGELGSLAFYASLAHYARRLACIVGRHWEFPAQVVAAVEHGATADAGSTALSEVLRLSDTTARIRQLVKLGLLQEDDVEACLDGDDVAACLACYREMAASEAEEGE